jgi:DNA-binding transcriptional LysR family regulator
MIVPDWTLLRAFQATASTGSLSAAARKLGLTQPSLSRQIAALEAQMGVGLFDRVGRRLVLTPLGRQLAEHATRMEVAAQGFALTAAAQEEWTKPVTLSVTDVIAAYTLPRIIQSVQARAPDVRLNIIVTNRFSDLHRREADIALRHAPPVGAGLRGDPLPDAQAGFYASRAWVTQHTKAETWADVLRGGLLGGDDPEQFAAYLTGIGLPTTPRDFRLCADSSVALWEMAQAGLGVCAMLTDVAQNFPQMLRLLPNHPAITVPFWIVTHEQLYDSPRIRLVREGLCAALGGPRQS